MGDRTYTYSFDAVFSLDEEQLERLNLWRNVQDDKQLSKEKQSDPKDLITKLLRDKNIPLGGAISFYFSPSNLCTHVKVLYKSTGSIVDLTKDDSNEFLYEYNEDFSKKFFMGEEVNRPEVLGVDY